MSQKGVEDSYYDLPQLAEDIDGAGKIRALGIIIGGGLSLAVCSESKTWGAVCISLLDRCHALLTSSLHHDRKTQIWSLKREIEQGDTSTKKLEEAASMVQATIRRVRGETWYHKWITQEFMNAYKNTNKDHPLLQILRKIGLDGYIRLATTNIDTIITEALGMHPVDRHDCIALQFLDRDSVAGAKLVLFLHGNWLRPEKVVLSGQDYKYINVIHRKEEKDRQIQTECPEMRKDVLKKMMRSMNILYLCCGGTLTDVHFLSALEHRREQQNRHFAQYMLLARHQTNQFRQMCEDFAIDQIVYPPVGEDQHAMLPYYLARLFPSIIPDPDRFHPFSPSPKFTREPFSHTKAPGSSRQGWSTKNSIQSPIDLPSPPRSNDRSRESSASSSRQDRRAAAEHHQSRLQASGSYQSTPPLPGPVNFRETGSMGSSSIHDHGQRVYYDETETRVAQRGHQASFDQDNSLPSASSYNAGHDALGLNLGEDIEDEKFPGASPYGASLYNGLQSPYGSRTDCSIRPSHNDHQMTFDMDPEEERPYRNTSDGHTSSLSPQKAPKATKRWVEGLRRKP